MVGIGTTAKGATSKVTAAKSADTGPTGTAVPACQFGWPAIIVPFLFVIAPNLIMVGDALDIVIDFFTPVAGIWFASAGFIGFLTRHLTFTQRLVYMIGGLGLLLPSQAFCSVYILEIVGGTICSIMLLIERTKKEAPV